MFVWGETRGVFDLLSFHKIKIKGGPVNLYNSEISIYYCIFHIANVTYLKVNKNISDDGEIVM